MEMDLSEVEKLRHEIRSEFQSMNERFSSELRAMKNGYDQLSMQIQNNNNYLCSQLNNAMNAWNHQFSTHVRVTEKKCDEIEEHIKSLQGQKEDEKAHRSLVIKNVDVLSGHTNKQELLKTLSQLGVNTEIIDDIWVTKKEHKNTNTASWTAILEASSPTKADKIKGQLIEILKSRIVMGEAGYKIEAGRKYFVSIEGFIPATRKEERSLLETRGKELKRDGSIAAYRVCLVKGGAPLAPIYFLGLQTKPNKHAAFRPHTIGTGQIRGDKKGGASRETNYGHGQRKEMGGHRTREGYGAQPANEVLDVQRSKEGLRVESEKEKEGARVESEKEKEGARVERVIEEDGVGFGINNQANPTQYTNSEYGEDRDDDWGEDLREESQNAVEVAEEGSLKVTSTLRVGEFPPLPISPGELSHDLRTPTSTTQQQGRSLHAEGGERRGGTVRKIHDRSPQEGHWKTVTNKKSKKRYFLNEGT
jgi:hypothetical protein